MMGLFDFFFKSKDLNKAGSSRVYDQEFSSDMFDKIYDTSYTPSFNSYTDYGVNVISEDNPIKLAYNGLLAKGGAKDLYAVVGYGNNLKWEDIETYPMQMDKDQGFTVSIPIKRQGNLNVAFKDSAGNWDNNYGMNYSFINRSYEGSH